MDTKSIKTLLQNRVPTEIGSYKRSSVIILLYEENDEIYLILEKRALNLRHQPGDICLPGGKIEEGESPIEAAIRETVEELGIDKEDLEVYSAVDYLITPFSVIMYPFVAKIKELKDTYSKDEVDSLIKIPLKFLMENEPIYHEGELIVDRGEDFPYDLIRGGEGYKFSKCMYPTYFYVWEDEVVWGHTARIIYEFIKILKKNKPS
ncbi:NUDIX hydrolase [Clostridium intestinale]|uniref:MutT/NUDIX NTP pyrophosphatase n=1 Tax=Clostridium intestinale URNW TaxID=1294142 RepID=U2Q5R3_9CLOT|nr:CoA pyrophosphatase [Clostridium intestinale]ERK31469.1 MutT/NUDIX NTP pyrophosphatase [Clostridium intestinale URNW]